MERKYKTSHKVYSAWNYQREIEDLNQASEQGWQLVRGGCFYSRFVKNPDVRYRYQVDFRKVDDMGRYIETFREQGWEYVSSTFNGWHFFRKLYDPALAEEDYEIFTDRESLREMNQRWSRIALTLAVIVGVLGVVCAIRMIWKPHLPILTQMILFFVECLFLVRGVLIMRNPDSSRNRRGDGVLLAMFFVTLVVGFAAMFALTEFRPYQTWQQQVEEPGEPLIKNQWISFEVHYPDNYYLDLEFRANTPLTFEIVNEKGETVYSETGTSLRKEDIRIKLASGEYWLSLTCDSDFEVKCNIN